MPEIVLRGQTIKYETRHSLRAKRISIRCTAVGSFEIVYPLRGPVVDPIEILMSKQRWLLRTINRFRENRSNVSSPQRYTSGAEIPFLGKSLTINIVEATNERLSIQRCGDLLRVVSPAPLCHNEDAVKTAVVEFYRMRAKAYFPIRIEELAQQHGLTYNRVFIKNQKTRWGSCSVKRNLNFNLRLMMAPPGAIDSVIIHELCHLKILNHSPAFWDLVAKLYPDYGQWQQWFKENGHLLVF